MKSMRIDGIVKPNRVNVYLKKKAREQAESDFGKGFDSIDIFDLDSDDSSVKCKYTIWHKRVGQGPFVASVPKGNILAVELDYLKGALFKRRKINKLLKSKNFDELEKVVSKRDLAKYKTPKLSGQYDCVDEVIGIEMKIKLVKDELSG